MLLTLININPDVLHFRNISSVVAISSPIDGNVSDILVEQGAFVSPTLPLLKVIDNRHLHLVLTFFEKDAVSLKEGQRVLFTLPEVSEQSFLAKVILISSNIDEKRSVQVNAHIDNEKSTNFISGMFVSAQIVIESEKGYGLLEASVAETQMVFSL
ncbi:efflux RND transporter periplasmic adaptor subunit [Capnocytophaga stomatis]|uniref:efflux RND transporter periplasmic adaptor subunit n=1 Tax=Capnocytophaga stomatis TaxID=1848904 RepID=UPI00385F25FE